jgi:uncharacterized membrane protein
MIEACAWGALAASSLLLGAAISYAFAPGRTIIAAVIALGSGLPLVTRSPRGVEAQERDRGLGYVVLDPASDRTGALAQAFTGSVVVVGFALAIALEAL